MAHGFDFSLLDQVKLSVFFESLYAQFFSFALIHFRHGWGSDRRENVSTKCHVVNAWHRETGVGSEEVKVTSALPSLESSTGSQACTQ